MTFDFPSSLLLPINLYLLQSQELIWPRRADKLSLWFVTLKRIMFKTTFFLVGSLGKQQSSIFCLQTPGRDCVVLRWPWSRYILRCVVDWVKYYYYNYVPNCSTARAWNLKWPRFSDFLLRTILRFFILKKNYSKMFENLRFSSLVDGPTFCHFSDFQNKDFEKNTKDFPYVFIIFSFDLVLLWLFRRPIPLVETKEIPCILAWFCQ